jgi:hypothetical protein
MIFKLVKACISAAMWILRVITPILIAIGCKTLLLSLEAFVYLILGLGLILPRPSTIAAVRRSICYTPMTMRPVVPLLPSL